MPLDSRSRWPEPFAPGLDLPPPFCAVALREVGDALAHATEIATRAGAGTLVYVNRRDLVEFAVVLEPEEPLRTARRVLYAGLTALADALAVHAPPEKPISFDWPGAIRIDDGLIGGARLVWPVAADENTPPPWLVFGAMIRTVGAGEQEPGLHPSATDLEAEGFDVESGRLLESFTRHFMIVVDTWQQDGFAKIARTYLSRIVSESGVRRDIDDNGDLLVRRLDKAGVERRPLVPALATPSWLDQTIRGPRL
jgi:biotin-(acetyl-CoA carboxylase) ligase